MMVQPEAVLRDLESAIRQARWMQFLSAFAGTICAVMAFVIVTQGTRYGAVIQAIFFVVNCLGFLVNLEGFHRMVVSELALKDHAAKLRSIIADMRARR